jgi:hypothetical protein
MIRIRRPEQIDSIADALRRLPARETGIGEAASKRDCHRRMGMYDLRVAARYALAALVFAFTATAGDGSSHAATQGNSGATSTGSITINASVASRVKISKLTDVTFSSVDVTAAVSDAQNVCVWSNTATKGYNITATGNGTGSAFTLDGGAGTSPMTYTVQWNQNSGQTSGTGLTSGTPLAGQKSTATQQNCSSGPATSASLIVGITATELANAVSSTTYTGVLTLVVAPE